MPTTVNTRGCTSKRVGFRPHSSIESNLSDRLPPDLECCKSCLCHRLLPESSCLDDSIQEDPDGFPAAISSRIYRWRSRRGNRTNSDPLLDKTSQYKVFCLPTIRSSGIPAQYPMTKNFREKAKQQLMHIPGLSGESVVISIAARMG